MNFYDVLVGMSCYSHFEELKNDSSSKKLIELPYDSAVLLTMYTKIENMDSDTCTLISVAFSSQLTEGRSNQSVS